MYRLLAAAFLVTWFCATACKGKGATAALELALTEPANGAVLATPPVAIRAFLSFDIDASSVDGESMRVAIDGAEVGGAVGVDPFLASALVFAPAAPLPADVVVQVVVDGRVRSRQGATLGSDRTFAFTVAAPGAASVQLGTTQVLWSGNRGVRLAPTVRCSADETGLAFHGVDLATATYAAAFWSVGANGWSAISSTLGTPPAGSAADMASATDGEGGMLVVSNGVAVHHARSLTSHFESFPFASFLQRIEPGPTTAWSNLALTAGTSIASYDWDVTTDSWAANLAAQTGPGIADPVAFVPLGPDGGQWLTWHTLPGLTTGQQLQARSRDRAGVDGAPVTLGEFPFLSLVAAAVAPSGRALVIVQVPAPFGRDVLALEHVPGQGWSSPTSIATVPSGTYAIEAAVADSGAAVVAVAGTDGVQSSVFLVHRAAANAWSPALQATLPDFALLGLDVAVADAGEACAALSLGHDLLLFARTAAGPWTPGVSMRDQAQLPGSTLTGVVDVEVAPIAAGRFLLIEELSVVGVGFLLQSVDLTVQ